MLKELALKIPSNDGSGIIIEGPKNVPIGGVTTAQRIIQAGVGLLLLAAVLLSLLYLVMGGIQWIMSGGDKAAVQAARQKVVYAILGLIVALSAFMVIKFIGTVFGISLLAK